MPEKISNSDVLHLGIRDHSLIYACRKIAFQKNQSEFVETRSYKNYNINNFGYDLSHALESGNCKNGDPNFEWHEFKKAFNLTADKHVPIKMRVCSLARR